MYVGLWGFRKWSLNEGMLELTWISKKQPQQDLFPDSEGEQPAQERAQKSFEIECPPKCAGSYARETRFGGSGDLGKFGRRQRGHFSWPRRSQEGSNFVFVHLFYPNGVVIAMRERSVYETLASGMFACRLRSWEKSRGNNLSRCKVWL